MNRLTGIRGAITVAENRPGTIRRAAARLLSSLVEQNGLDPENVVTAFFTSTPDLDAGFPATAARLLGWTEIPLMGAQELSVDGSIPRCIRILVLANLPLGQKARHVYLDGAAKLRPDLAELRGPGSAPAALNAIGGDGTRHRLVIAGLGLIGGSVAAALAHVGDRWEVWGADSDRATCEAAVKLGVVERAVALEELARTEADVILLAAPVDQILELLDGWARNGVVPRGVVTDVGSTKEAIVEAYGRLPQGTHWVGGHPIAGSEASSFAARRAELFEGRTWVLTRERQGPADRLAAVESLLGDVGAIPLEVEAGRHDQVLARTSHLPYLVAGAVARVVAGLQDASISALVGSGFRDTTRVAAQGLDMGHALVMDNRACLAEAVRELAGDLLGMAERLEEGDGEAIHSRLEAATKARERVMADGGAP